MAYTDHLTGEFSYIMSIDDQLHSADAASEATPGGTPDDATSDGAAPDGAESSGRRASGWSKVRAVVVWAWNNPVVQVIVVIVALAGAFYNGVKYGPVLWGPEPSSVVPEVVYQPAIPMAGETDAVLSLQILRPGNVPYHRCTATLVDNPLTDTDDNAGEWALTAAHCITTPPPEVQKQHDAQSCADTEDAASAATKLTVDHPETAPFVARGATTVFTRGGQTAAVAERHIVSGWNWGRTPGAPENDIALLRLAHPMNITPMPLATSDQVPGAFGVAYGWSTGADFGCRTDISRDVQQFPLRVDPCPAEPEAGKDMCAGTPNDAAGPCNGASGGPLVSLDTNEHPTLHGVYSDGRGTYCGQGPMSFTSVARNRQWIVNTMSANP